MSGDIVLSAGIRQNLLSLQNTSTLQQTTQERLATGKKVNSALDNAVNYFTSSSLSQRANELNNLLDSMTNGINTLKAASNGLTSITTTIQSMQATVTQARQDASWQSTSYNIGSFSTATVKFLTLANGAVGTTPVPIALNTADSPGATKTSTNAGSAFSTVTTSFAQATNASVTQGAYTNMDFRNGGANNGQIAFTLNVDGTPHPVTIAYADVSALGGGNGAAVTASELAGVINAKAGGNYASVDGTGKLVFTSPTTGATSTV
jgi:flagellin